MNHYRKSIEKLMAEGYTLLRLGNVKEAKGWPVTYSDSTTGYGNWRIYDYYDTKALRDNVVNRLVTEERYLVL